MGFNEIQNILGEAIKSAGVDRETLLFHALNQIFQSHAATQKEWSIATSESRSKWQRQMDALLSNLEFCLECADAYGGTDESLLNEINEKRKRISVYLSRESDLNKEQAALENKLAELKKACTDLQNSNTSLETSIKEKTEEAESIKNAKEKTDSDIRILKYDISVIREEKEKLEKEKYSLQEKHREAALQKDAVEKEARDIRSVMKRETSTLSDLEHERDVLVDLRNVIEWRFRLEDALGREKARHLADGEIVAGMKSGYEELMDLHNKIKDDLNRAEEMMKNEIVLSMKQWEDLRNRLGRK